LYPKFGESTIIVTLGALGDRFCAAFHDDLDEKIVGLQRNNLVHFAENSDFRLTDKGIAECRNRHRTSNSWCI
jgi:hypothetical protein